MFVDVYLSYVLISLGVLFDLEFVCLHIGTRVVYRMPAGCQTHCCTFATGFVEHAWTFFFVRCLQDFVRTSVGGLSSVYGMPIGFYFCV